MREYAEVALGSMREARDLVKHYFTLAKQEFIRRYFAGREEVLKLATSEESWRSIVERLAAWMSARLVPWALAIEPSVSPARTR